MHFFNDPLLMPGTRETPEQVLKRAVPLDGTDGAEYVMKRGIAVETAHQAGVRYCEKYTGRAAVIQPLRDQTSSTLNFLPSAVAALLNVANVKESLSG